MAYALGAVERAMKVQEVILRALSGQLTWLQAADILGRSPRSIRRLRLRYERYGYDGLFDHRRHTPSPRRAAVADVERLLQLYRTRYQGFNVRHFLRTARREHGVPFCYAFVKKALQGAGLVPKHRPRGRHRRRREPRPCFGELLHLDGSRHHWLTLVPEQWLTLLAVVDDAAGGAADRTKLTQVGRALAHLGIEHILGYSPQARGRSERMNRTLQDRLVNELRVEGITTPAAANRYVRERFLPEFNAEFRRPPTDPASAFVPLGRVDLEQILCHQDERVVGRDNTVVLDGVVLQLAKQAGRRTCAGLRVLVRRHLDGRHSVWLGSRRLGLYDARGRTVTSAAA